MGVVDNNPMLRDGITGDWWVVLYGVSAPSPADKRPQDRNIPRAQRCGMAGSPIERRCSGGYRIGGFLSVSFTSKLGCIADDVQQNLGHVYRRVSPDTPT